MAGKLVDTILTLIGEDFESRVPEQVRLSCPRAIIKLGTTGTIKGFDIDTSHFNGMFTEFVNKSFDAFPKAMRLLGRPCKFCISQKAKNCPKLMMHVCDYAAAHIRRRH